VANETDGQSWSLCAFATVYEFFQYPDQRRARLSQIVVLPPFQRQGLGASVLEATRTFAVNNNLKDVTVEDPTAQLSRLRDVSDVRALATRPAVMLHVKLAAMRAAALKKDDPNPSAALRLPKQVAEEAREFLKLSAPQIKRCWEALLYIFAKSSGASDVGVAAGAFTELVVNRLRKAHCGDYERDAGAKRMYDSNTNLFAAYGKYLYFPITTRTPVPDCPHSSFRRDGGTSAHRHDCGGSTPGFPVYVIPIPDIPITID